MRELKFIHDRQSLQVIYFSFIRPYADVVLDNNTQYEANEIERKKKIKWGGGGGGGGGSTDSNGCNQGHSCPKLNVVK